MFNLDSSGKKVLAVHGLITSPTTAVYALKKLTNADKRRLRTEMRRRHVPYIGLADYYDLSDDWMYRHNLSLLYMTSRVSSDMDRIMDTVRISNRGHAVTNC